MDIAYSGAPDVVRILEGGNANPTALATADFNADGAPDVVAGYSTARGGVLTMLRGNPDAFAPKDTSLFRKAMHGNVPATFLPTAQVYLLPERPDLILTGDFNRDGNRDVLVAARGGRLYLLAGDGTGKLGTPEPVSLGGPVRAMAATGDGHVALSIDGAHGPELQILAPGRAGLLSEVAYPLPGRGDAVLWGDLGGGADVAVGAGSHIAIFYNPLKGNPQKETLQTETIDLPFKVNSLTADNFIWDRDGRTEIAVLAEDGSIHILQHGSLDTRPLTSADIPGRRAALREKRKQERVNPASLGAWSVAKVLQNSGPAPAGPLSQTAFSSPHLAAAPTNDLMVLDAGGDQLHILDTSGKAESPSATVPFSGAPVAALALPQKIDAHRETIVLVKGLTRPIAFDQGGDPTLTVNRTADEDTEGACATNSTITATQNLPSTLSLRQAICVANNSGSGNYTINVQEGTYQLNISTYAGNGTDSTQGFPATSAGELQSGTKSGTNITIVGLGQTPATTIIEQKDGVDRVLEQDPLGNGNIPLTIQNVTLTGGLCTTGLDCGFSGGAVLGGGYAGDTLTLTSVVVSSNSEQADTPALGGGNQGGGVASAGPGFSITNSTFSGNSVTASSTNAGIGGGVDFLDDVVGNLSITNSTFIDNTVPASSIGAQGGGLWISLNTIGDTATISGSTFTGNSVAGSNGEGGAIFTAGLTTVTNSRFAGNTAAGGGSGFWEQGYAGNSADGVGNVINNWWGCNAGPTTNGSNSCDTVDASGVPGDDASVSYSPYLVLSISANPTTINVNDTSTLTANLTHNSNGVGGFSVPNGTPVSFGGTDGIDNPTNPTLSSGGATSTFTGTTEGTGSGSATVDSQTVSVTIDITGQPTLAITKSHTGTFTQGSTAEWDIQVYNVAGSISEATTGATVTMVDTLPANYTLSSYTGSGWGCTGSTTVTCTSTAVVNGGSGFPVISLIVNVPATSPTSVTNNAVVFGGGDPSHTNSGNGATAFETVNNVVQVPASILLTAGNNQSVTVGTAFSSLSVTVEDAAGNPISGKSVTYASPVSGPSGTFSNSTNTITANTNGSGVIGVSFTANSKAGGPYNIAVSASSVTSNFSETNLAGAPASITANSGTTPQFATDLTAFAIPLAVTVLDLFNNPVSGVSVTFAAPSSGASLGFNGNGGASTYTVSTDGSGTANAGTVTANGTFGGPYSVTAAANSFSTSFSLTNVIANILWIGNTNNQTSAFLDIGTTYLSSAESTGGTGVAIDSSGNVWTLNAGGNTVSEFTSIGSSTSTTISGGGLDAGSSLAVDGLNQVWITNTGGTISAFNSARTPITPSTGYTVGTTSPTSIAIDISGNVWIASGGSNSVTKVLGAAAPTVQLATGVANGTSATEP
ncbi:MAG: hypothetical protein ABSG96_09920 [Terracidiphilus sp.]